MKMTVPMEIGLVVCNMDSMISFYVDVLGLKLVGDSQSGAKASTSLGTAPNGYRIVRLQTPYGERVKFVLPKGGAQQPTPAPQWVYDRQGLCYITFVVSDLGDIVKILKENDVKLMSQPAEARPGILCVNAVDPEGNFLEFVQYADFKAYRPDLFN